MDSGGEPSGSTATRTDATPGAPDYAQHRKQLRKKLPALSDKQLRKLPIHRLPEKVPGGTSVKYIVFALVPDKKGRLKERHFTFKPAPDAQHFFERDSFANELRRAADEPALVAARQRLPVNDHEAIAGWMRPRVSSKGRALSNRPEDWTEAARLQVAVDAVWSEFLGNCDMKTDQYTMCDVKDKHTGAVTQTVFNHDWDLTLHDYERTAPLDRYKTYKWKIPTAQNLLFLAFVYGKVDVDFGAMRDAVERIQALDDDDVKKHLQPLIETHFAGAGRFGPFATGAELEQAVLERKATLASTFERFIESLLDERGVRTAPKDQRPRRAVRGRWKDQRVRLLGRVGTSPVLRAYNTFNRRLNTLRHRDEVVAWP